MRHVGDAAGRRGKSLPRGRTVRVALLAWAFSLTAGSATGQAPALDVSVSARSLGLAAGFEAFVDARRLSAPYDLKSVEFLILCRAPNGSMAVHPVFFHPSYLARGFLYRKTLPWPADCAEWVRLQDARVTLLAGKSDGPDADVAVKQGALGGGSVNLSPPPPAPQPTGPAHGSVFGHYPRNLTLSWTPVLGAVSYTLQIESGFQGRWYPHLLVPNLKATSYSFQFVGAQPGRWRVWALDSEGRAGWAAPWSEFLFTR